MCLIGEHQLLLMVEIERGQKKWWIQSLKVHYVKEYKKDMLEGFIMTQLMMVYLPCNISFSSYPSLLKTSIFWSQHCFISFSQSHSYQDFTNVVHVCALWEQGIQISKWNSCVYQNKWSRRCLGKIYVCFVAESCTKH